MPLLSNALCERRARRILHFIVASLRVYDIAPRYITDVQSGIGAGNYDWNETGGERERESLDA